MRFSAQEKLKAVNAVITQGESVTNVAQKYGVSRKTIYTWLGSHKHTRSLDSKYTKGPKHHRFYRNTFKHKLRREIVKDPRLSITKLATKLKVGRHALYTALKEEGLSTQKDRENFVNLYKSPCCLATDIKLSIVRKAATGEVTVAALAKDNKIARKTIYKWIKSYQENANIDEKYKSGFAHHKSLGREAEEKILAQVTVNPNLSIHSLAVKTGFSSHGVFNILKKHSLTHKNARVAYSRAAQTEVQPAPITSAAKDRVRSVLPKFVPSLAPARIATPSTQAQ